MKKLAFLIALLFLVFHSTNAQTLSGETDTTFNTSDIGFGYGSIVGGVVRDIVKVPDGRVLVFGGGYYALSYGIMRMPNGESDTAFNNNLAAAGISYTQLNGATLLPNGQMYVYGSGIWRVNADGTRDLSFTNVVSSGVIKSVAVQTDGKVIVGGDLDGLSEIGNVRRLNSNGTIDNSFTYVYGTYDAPVNAVGIQADGKIVAVGDFTQFLSNSQKGIVRLNTDGTQDLTFFANGSNRGFTGSAKNMIMLNDTFIVVGKFMSFNGANRGGVVRVLPNGQIDPSMGNVNILFTVTDIDKTPDGKFVITEGIGNEPGIKVRKLLPNGQADPTFTVATTPNSSVSYGVAALANGKIMVCGQFRKMNNSIVGSLALLNSNGILEKTFPTTSGFNNTVTKVIECSDGKILVTGSFNRYYDRTVNCLVKLNPDATLDTLFNYNNVGADISNTVPQINDMDTALGGKIYITGIFTSYNGQPASYVARLNADGTLDNTFNYAGNNNGTSTNLKIKVYQNNKLLVYNGNYLVRLNNDGSIDNSFTTNISGIIKDIAILPDGKIVCVGVLTPNNNFTIYINIIRLNTNGTEDNTFTPPTLIQVANNNFTKIIPLNNGQFIVLVECSNNPNNVPYNKRIIRINSNGTIDNTFNPPGVGFTVLGTSFSNILLQPDGKMVIGGLLYSFNNQPVNEIIRLMPDGSYDNTFKSLKLNYFGNPSGGSIFTTSLMRNGNLLFGGVFTDIDSIGRNRISISKNLITFAPILPNDSLCAANPFSVTIVTKGTLEQNNTYTVQLSDNTGSFTSPLTIGSLASADDTVTIQCTIPTSVITGNNYKIRYITSNLISMSVDNGYPVTVISTPPPPALFIVSSDTVCQGQTGVQYSVPSIPNYTYQWSYTGTGATINDTTNSISIDFSATATPGILSVTQTNYCNLTSQALTLPIYINNLPDVPVFTSFQDTIYATDTLVEFSVDYNPQLAYSWSYDGFGTTITDTLGVATIVVDSTITSGLLSVIATNTCGNSLPLTLPIVIAIPPYMPGLFIVGEDTVYQGDNDVVYSIPDGRADVEQYQWQFSGTGATINGTGASISMNFSSTATSGILGVQAVNNFGVSPPRQMFITVLEPLGVNTEINSLFTIHSANNSLIINSNKNAKIEIYDTQGRLVMPTQYINNGKSILDIISAQGMYIVRINIDGNIYTKKLIVKY